MCAIVTLLEFTARRYHSFREIFEKISLIDARYRVSSVASEQRNFRGLRVDGDRVLDADGARVQLRGVGLGGWMNMENFITGYPANESAMRAAVARVLGAERAERFFGALLDRFFTADDAQLLASLGVNCVRLPVNYRHFGGSAGFERLDRAIRTCAEHGIYSVIDLHAVPGCQNQHWHSDNATHVAAFWEHAHFQDV